jgi:hypothetical protein
VPSDGLGEYFESRLAADGLLIELAVLAVFERGLGVPEHVLAMLDRGEAFGLLRTASL